MRASAFFVLDKRAWERAIVRHLDAISVVQKQNWGLLLTSERQSNCIWLVTLPEMPHRLQYQEAL